ncbi:uncharacterized protein LOC135813417 [Sycon ciliatum]|uniref:uncharacterized protein LOC135813417 n=1 Tax=Sycon ciliatum TaxID=27933 RepID=UPI0031F6FB5C
MQLNLLSTVFLLRLIISVWPRPPTIQRPDRVQLTLPAAVSNYLYEVVRILPNGNEVVVGRYQPSDSRQQTISAQPGENYRLGLRARSIGSPSQVSGIGSTVSFNIPAVPRPIEPPTVPTVPGRSGTIKTGDLRATWQVNGEGGVDVGLSTNLQNRWMGFGISRNGFMTNSDMITGYINGDGQAVVEDRFAFGRIRPAVDSDSQVSDVQGRRQGGRDYISFTIPCNSPDPRDVPLEGRRSLLLAMGPVRGSLISYHSDGRSASPLVQIDCSARQAPAPAPSPAATTSVVSVNVDLPQELSGSTGQDQHWIVDIRESLRDGNWSSFQTIAVVETSRPSLSITLPTGNLYELSFRGSESNTRITRTVST